MRHQRYENEPLSNIRKNRVLLQNSPLKLEKYFKTTNTSVDNMDRRSNKEGNKEVTKKKTITKSTCYDCDMVKHKVRVTSYELRVTS